MILGASDVELDLPSALGDAVPGSDFTDASTAQFSASSTAHQDFPSSVYQHPSLNFSSLSISTGSSGRPTFGWNSTSTHGDTLSTTRPITHHAAQPPPSNHISPFATTSLTDIHAQSEFPPFDVTIASNRFAQLTTSTSPNSHSEPTCYLEVASNPAHEAEEDEEPNPLAPLLLHTLPTPTRPHSNRHRHPVLLSHQRHFRRVIPSACCQVPPRIKPWLPMLAWFATTIGFLLAITFWHVEVFQGLDDLSTYLKDRGFWGMITLFSLIFITTFPPLPLYSTLMMLSGYTYGPTTGFLISYTSSILGAIFVFLLFRHFVPTSLASKLLPPSLTRVIRAIEQRPSIFLLIRIAPYPYNVLNAVLGSSSRMPFAQYAGTTALSLCKVIVHATLGSQVRSFAEMHAEPDPEEPEDENPGVDWKEVWTVLGILLCVGLFVYLAIVAHRAVDKECVDDGEGEIDVPSPAVSSSGVVSGSHTARVSGERTNARGSPKESLERTASPSEIENGMGSDPRSRNDATFRRSADSRSSSERTSTSSSRRVSTSATVEGAKVKVGAVLARAREAARSIGRRSHEGYEPLPMTPTVPLEFEPPESQDDASPRASEASAFGVSVPIS